MTGGTPVVITFHPHPLQVLAPNNAPLQIQTLRQRLALFESLGIPLTVVIPFNIALAQINAREFALNVLWERLRPREVYVGPNFAFGNRRQGSFNLLKEIGEKKGFATGKIVQVQFRGSRVSSTAIRQALVCGQAGLARRLLGRPFALEGTVVHGSGLGSKLRFPTANIKTPNELVPRRGVYVTMLRIDGNRYRSVSNIGYRPTVNPDEGATLSIEAHVFDFDRDIYGMQVELEFLARLRDERRFSGRQELVEQIRKDIENARRYFRILDRMNIPLCGNRQAAC
ncbi:MAG TPA: riboflavin biosynthesis protein RibF, partial [Acidobacteriota bacterium]|nr:riboflavin biosynthesis protein RibF [Acidobacteriota bacterium]